MLILKDVVNELVLPLRTREYKKNGLSWYKEKNHITIVFSIQKSQYTESIWYYWFGICVHPIAKGSVHSINNCQIKYRLDNEIRRTVLDVPSVIKLLERWEAMYGDLHLLKLCAIQGKLPIQSTASVVRYLTSIDISTLLT